MPKPFAPATPQSSPGAQPAIEADTLTLPDGREVPNDLLALLHRPSTVARLVAAGIETTRELLRLSDEARKFTPRTGPALWGAVADLLEEHQPGVKLGCLAPAAQPQAQGPPHLRALEGGRKPRRTAADLDLSFMEEPARANTR